MSRRQLQVLEAIRKEPGLTSRQYAWRLRLHGPNVAVLVCRLRKGGHVKPANLREGMRGRHFPVVAI